MFRFVDDLQWSSKTELNLIRKILCSPEKHHLLLLGAFRSNEVMPGDLLAVILDQIQNDSHVYMETIELGPLDLESVNSIVSTTLIGNVDPVKHVLIQHNEHHHITQRNIYEFTTLVYNKTEGNPFFVLQASVFDTDASILFSLVLIPCLAVEIVLC
jgi:predicted ATPase